MKSTLFTFVTRLGLSHFSLTMCSVLLWAALLTKFPDRDLLSYSAALFILLISIFNQYQIAWKTGERDRNLVKYNRLTYRPARGFAAGTIAVLPSLAVLIGLLIFTGLTVYIFFIVLAGPAPISAGIGYLNGHKLKSAGISIIYRKKG